jgi:CBS domain containing-hemolysin-like protein
VIHIAGLTAVLLCLIATNGVYVAAEFALVAVRPTRLARLAAEGNRAAVSFQRWVRSRDRQAGYLATTQLGITVASLALGMYGEQQIAGRLAPRLMALGRWSEAGAHALALVIAVGLLTYSHVVLGEMMPKSIALRYPEPVALGVERIMVVSEAVFRPLVALLRASGGIILKALRLSAPSAEERILDPEELALMIGESASGGLIPPRSRQILLRVFDFGDRTASQIMTPRSRIVAFPVAIGEEELASRLAMSRHTRFPIYDGDLDHIIGTLHLKDFIRWQLGDRGAFGLRRLVRPARRVGERMSARELLEAFRGERGHMAIVTNPKGVTVGLVTLEDVAEELVGEVRDEFDPRPTAERDGDRRPTTADA